jgi:hypothetical protein
MIKNQFFLKSDLKHCPIYAVNFRYSDKKIIKIIQSKN